MLHGAVVQVCAPPVPGAGGGGGVPPPWWPAQQHWLPVCALAHTVATGLKTPQACAVGGQAAAPPDAVWQDSPEKPGWQVQIALGTPNTLVVLATPPFWHWPTPGGGGVGGGVTAPTHCACGIVVSTPLTICWLQESPLNPA